MFFFFKQKTAYEMRISDWSSDVCSSDLSQATRAEQPFRSLRHGISEQGKPEIQSEQATDKGQRHDIFQPVFDQEDGDEECRQNRVEKAANRQAFGGICAERTPVAMQHLHTCLSRYEIGRQSCRACVCQYV